MTLTDENCLLQYIHEGNRGALELLIQRHYERAFQLAFKNLGDPAAADDAVQEAFVSLIRSGRRFRKDGRFAPWFNQVLFNAIRKEARKRSRRLKHETVAAREWVESDSQRPEMIQAVEDHLSQLSMDHQTVLSLHFFEGLSYAEIGKALDVPKSTIASRVRSGLEKLRASMSVAGYCATLAAIQLCLTNKAEAATLPTLSAPALSQLEALAAKQTVGVILLKASLSALCLSLLLFVAPSYTDFKNNDPKQLIQQAQSRELNSALSAIKDRPRVQAKNSSSQVKKKALAAASQVETAAVRQSRSAAPGNAPVAMNMEIQQAAAAKMHTLKVVDIHGRPAKNALVQLLLSKPRNQSRKKRRSSSGQDVQTAQTTEAVLAMSPATAENLVELADVSESLSSTKLSLGNITDAIVAENSTAYSFQWSSKTAEIPPTESGRRSNYSLYQGKTIRFLSSFPSVGANVTKWTYRTDESGLLVIPRKKFELVQHIIVSQGLQIAEVAAQLSMSVQTIQLSYIDKYLGDGAALTGQVLLNDELLKNKSLEVEFENLDAYGSTRTLKLLTEESGRFMSPVLAPGRYRISAVAPEQRLTSEVIELKSGQVKDYDLQLQSSYWLPVHVLNAEGLVRSGLRLRVQVIEAGVAVNAQQKISRHRYQEAIVDGLGHGYLKELDQREYEISLSYFEQEIYRARVTPSGLQKNASVDELTSEEVFEINLQDLQSFQGQLQFAGKAIAKTPLFTVVNGRQFMTMTNDQGEFSFVGLRAGQYQVQIDAVNRGRKALKRMAPLSLFGRETEIDLSDYGRLQFDYSEIGSYVVTTRLMNERGELLLDRNQKDQLLPSGRYLLLTMASNRTTNAEEVYIQAGQSVRVKPNLETDVAIIIVRTEARKAKPVSGVQLNPELDDSVHVDFLFGDYVVPMNSYYRTSTAEVFKVPPGKYQVRRGNKVIQTGTLEANGRSIVNFAPIESDTEQ